MTDLLLLALAAIIISEYAERRSFVGGFANLVTFIAFALCSLWASDNFICVYVCKQFLGNAYPILHTAILAPMAYIRFGFSAYLAAQVFGIIVVLLAGAISILHVFFTIKGIVLARRNVILLKRQNLDETAHAVPSRTNTIFLLFSRLLN